VLNLIAEAGDQPWVLNLIAEAGDQPWMQVPPLGVRTLPMLLWLLCDRSVFDT